MPSTGHQKCLDKYLSTVIPGSVILYVLLMFTTNLSNSRLSKPIRRHSVNVATVEETFSRTFWK